MKFTNLLKAIDLHLFYQSLEVTIYWIQLIKLNIDLIRIDTKVTLRKFVNFIFLPGEDVTCYIESLDN